MAARPAAGGSPMSFWKAVSILLAVSIAAVVVAALAPGGRSTKSAPDAAVRAERGRYLVASIGCADCHSPKVQGAEGPEPDMTRFLSGHLATLELPAPPQLPAGPWTAAASAD